MNTIWPHIGISIGLAHLSYNILWYCMVCAVFIIALFSPFTKDILSADMLNKLLLPNKFTLITAKAKEAKKAQVG